MTFNRKGNRKIARVIFIFDDRVKVFLNNTKKEKRRVKKLINDIKE